MTVTRCPHAIQRETWPYRFVPVPPPWGWVQSRSVSSRMCRGVRWRSSRGTRGAKVPRREAEGRPSAGSIECRRVPSVCRRIVVLLVVALLGAGVPVTAVHAQGAGDQQYEDPFGGSGDSGNSGSGGSGSGGSNSGSGDIDPITPAPQTSGGSSGGGGSGSGSSSGTAATGQSGTATPSPSSPAATGTLPNTG